MSLVKTPTTLLTIVSTASNVVTLGTAVDVGVYHGATGKIRMGRATGTGFTAAPEFRIELGFLATMTAADWVTVMAFSPALGATIASSAVSGTEAIGQTVVTVASGTNFVMGDFIFFHNTTIANSEWKHIQSVATNDITLQDALVFAQTGATARDQAEEYPFDINLAGAEWMRLVVNGAVPGGSGQAVIVEASMDLFTL